MAISDDRSPSLRILLVESADAATGAVRSIVAAATELRVHHGVEFVFTGPANAHIQESGFRQLARTHSIPRRSVEILEFPFRVLLDAHWLAETARREGVDLIHVNDFYMMGACVGRMLKILPPVVYHVRLRAHSYLGAVYGLMTAASHRWSDAVVAVSECVRKDLGASDVDVVPDGIRVERECPPPPPPKSAVTVVYVGHLIPGKGQNLALEAVASAVSKGADIRVKFIGGSLRGRHRDYANHLRRVATALCLDDRVTWAGPAPNAADEMQAADVVLNLSESESFSMVCLEGMAAGRPVIASDCGGPRELLSKPGSGILVRNRDTEAAAAALVELAASRELRVRMGREAHQVAMSRYHVQYTSEQLLSVYRRVLTRHA